MKATVDKDLCLGCGLCPEICPEVFEMQADKAVVMIDSVPDGVGDSCRDAAQQCPAEAIKISEDA
jgi:ferredoxin